MRALARDHLSPLAKNGIDYVLIARHDTATANWQEMANGLQKAIHYLHRTIATDTNRGAKPNAKPLVPPKAELNAAIKAERKAGQVGEVTGQAKGEVSAKPMVTLKAKPKAKLQAEVKTKLEQRLI